MEDNIIKALAEAIVCTCLSWLITYLGVLLKGNT